ncbi:MAG: UbiD family decarboxylase [Deltaproteobacteria bacterium]|nr:UbiD family decarboxylase [Deltaproteobacteria bacterium]
MKDLRQFLDMLKKNGELLSITDEVDPRFEISEFLRQVDKAGGPALLFEKVKGNSARIAGNLVGTRRRLALAFGAQSDLELLEMYQKRRARRMTPRTVRSGPVKEVVIKGEKKVDLNALPIPTYHEGDGGPYVTCGILAAKDPVSGLRSMGLHRLHIKGPRRVGVHLSNPPISRFAAEAEEKKKPLDVAISLGVHPIILLASIVSSPTEDKVAIASSLMGSPISLVKGETVNAEAPADAEVVIEGRILPNVREKEGPFGETSGYYFSDESHVIEVTAITHRESPIIQALHPTVHEVSLLGGPAGEAEMTRMLKERGFAVTALAITPSSNRTHVAISIQKKHESEPRQLLHFILSGVPYIKHAVVVDDDVNVNDAEDIEWAVATRFQGDLDLVVIPDMRARSIDPSKKQGNFMTKVGLDATVPLPLRERFKRITVPLEVTEKVAGIVSRLWGKGVKSQ